MDQQRRRDLLNNAAVAELHDRDRVSIETDELRTLIDGYERRGALLIEARNYVPSISAPEYINDRTRIKHKLLTRIDTELEGDHDN